MVVVSARSDSRLWLRMARALSDREKQTGDISISTLVIHGRLQNDRPDVDRKTSSQMTNEK